MDTTFACAKKVGTATVSFTLGSSRPESVTSSSLHCCTTQRHPAAEAPSGCDNETVELTSKPFSRSLPMPLTISPVHLSNLYKWVEV